jgi:hypothetical protein
MSLVPYVKVIFWHACLSCCIHSVPNLCCFILGCHNVSCWCGSPVGIVWSRLCYWLYTSWCREADQGRGQVSVISMRFVCHELIHCIACNTCDEWSGTGTGFSHQVLAFSSSSITPLILNIYSYIIGPTDNLFIGSHGSRNIVLYCDLKNALYLNITLSYVSLITVLIIPHMIKCPQLHM